MVVEELVTKIVLGKQFISSNVASFQTTPSPAATLGVLTLESPLTVEIMETRCWRASVTVESIRTVRELPTLSLVVREPTRVKLWVQWSQSVPGSTVVMGHSWSVEGQMRSWWGGVGVARL